MNGSEFFDYSLPVRTASNSLHFGANFIRLSLKEKKLTFTTYFAIGLNIKIWITFERIRIFFDYSLPVRTASNSLHFGANFIRLSLKEKKLTFTTYFAIGLNIKIWITFERIRIFRLFITSKNSFKFSAF